MSTAVSATRHAAGSDPETQGSGIPEGGDPRAIAQRWFRVKARCLDCPTVVDLPALAPVGARVTASLVQTDWGHYVDLVIRPGSDT